MNTNEAAAHPPVLRVRVTARLSSVFCGAKHVRICYVASVRQRHVLTAHDVVMRCLEMQDAPSFTGIQHCLKSQAY